MIEYRESADGICADQLRGFFVGWSAAPSPAQHLEMIRGSQYAVLAIDASSNQVVGFVTAITDGVLAAYIPLLEVLPGFQRQGIGHQLMQRILRRLERFYMIDLLCDPPLQPFYSALGMKPAHGMALRNREWGRKAS